MMSDILADPQQASCVHPLFGGVDLNTMPVLAPCKWAINVSGIADESALARFPDVERIIREKVKPERDRLPDNSNNRPLKRRWWAYQAHRPELYRRMQQTWRFLAHAEISPHLAFRFVDCGPVYIKTVILFDVQTYAGFGLYQARIHELWARFFASTMEDRLRYTPTDCFATFAVCHDVGMNAALESAGEVYHEHRATLMIARNEGLTKTYNRFHDPAERAPDIQRLRELHHAMDVAVLRAYGWDDLAQRAAPEFLDESSEPDHRYQDRLFWPASFRDEVLTRLLALNAERAAAERAAGLTPGRHAVQADELEDVE